MNTDSRLCIRHYRGRMKNLECWHCNNLVSYDSGIGIFIIDASAYGGGQNPVCLQCARENDPKLFEVYELWRIHKDLLDAGDDDD